MSGKYALAIIIVAVVVPAVSWGGQEKRPSGKELAVHHSKNCADLASSMQEKVKTLQEEIEKGRRIYTPEDIRKLEEKLRETEEMMDYMMYSPGN